MNHWQSGYNKMATKQKVTVSLSKRIRLIFCLIITFFALPTLARIQGSAHDFTSYEWSTGDVCDVCHISDQQDALNSAGPLWNHEISSAIYSLYKSSSLHQTPQQPDAGNVSRLCLSCHDGTIALDAFGGNMGEKYFSANRSWGTDLRNSHPVNVKLVRFGAGGAHQSTGIKLYEGMVECPSCHDVHNEQVADKKLLRVTRAGSQLCFQCHEK